jgi:hypothetical protein
MRLPKKSFAPFPAKLILTTISFNPRWEKTGFSAVTLTPSHHPTLNYTTEAHIYQEGIPV